MCEAVGKNNSLEFLDLSLNQISDGKAIGNALQQSHTLKDLDLFDNLLLGDNCAIAIGKCVPKHLVKLKLATTELGMLVPRSWHRLDMNCFQP